MDLVVAGAKALFEARVQVEGVGGVQAPKLRVGVAAVREGGRLAGLGGGASGCSPVPATCADQCFFCRVGMLMVEAVAASSEVLVVKHSCQCLVGLR